MSKQHDQRKILDQLMAALREAPDATRLPIQMCVLELLAQMDNPVFENINDPVLAIRYGKSRLELLNTLIHAIGAHQRTEVSRMREARALVRENAEAVIKAITRIREAGIIIEVNKNADTPESILARLEQHEARLGKALARGTK